MDDDPNAYGGDCTPVKRRRVDRNGFPIPDDPRDTRAEESGGWMTRLRSSGALSWASQKRRTY